jgi:hypothetical protein
MIIKSAPQKPPGRLATALRGKVRRALLISTLTLVAIPAITLGSIYYGMVLHETKVADSFATFFENAVQTKLDLAPNFVRGQLVRPDRLTIDMKHTEFQKLAYKRDTAMQTGVLLTGPEDYVPAKIRFGAETYKVKVRLKGDWVDHLAGDKWSFRVKVGGDETLFGMNKFSLHHPKTRNWVHEWIFHEALEREGIISLRYRFVDVVLNGKPLGVYALEEHFDKRLVESNRHREGPILKLSEDAYWPDVATFGKGSKASMTGLQSQSVANVEAFRIGKIKTKPMLEGELRKAMTLLEGCRAGEIAVGDAFDAGKLARYFAICDVMGASHAAIWFNLRFYYNPVTSRLEPVGFDGNAGEPLEQLIGSNRADATESVRFKDICFSDTDFYGRYVKALSEYSDERWLDSLLDDVDEGLTANLGILYREFPYYHFSTRVYRDNQARIRGAIDPNKAFHAFYQNHDETTVTLELGNIQPLPVEVLGLETFVGVPSWLSEPIVLRAHDPAGLPSYGSVTFEIPGPDGWTAGLEDSLKVRYRVLGTDQPRAEAVFGWVRQDPTTLEEDVTRVASTVDSFGFLVVNEDLATIRVERGHWKVDRDLVIPPGYMVELEGGTEIDIVSGATILSRSAFHMFGTEEAPIVFGSSDSTAQGFVVLEAENTSRLEHVYFRNLGNPDVVGWNVTGAVTFYESPLEAIGCEFGTNRCEDALNTIRTTFDIDGSLFRDTFGDAFDSDFCTGTVRSTSFVRCGNDGIDVSGSTVSVEEVTVDGAGDKAVSGGEASVVTMSGLRVKNANIGVASKDQTVVEGTDVAILDTNIGLTAFRKKSEFGPATMDVRRLALDGVGTVSLVETGSSVVIDGERQLENGTDVKRMLY